MPNDPIWVDTCTLVLIGDGDFALELELKNLRSTGRDLLIVPAVRHELLHGNPLTTSPKRPVWEQAPSATERERRVRMLNRLGVKLDVATNRVPPKIRVGNVMQDHLPRHPQDKSISKFIDTVSQSDGQVLSQIKASAQVRGVKNPIVFTAEEGNKAMVTKAHLYGVTSMVRKTPKPPKGGGGGGGGGKVPGNVPKLTLSEYPPDKELPVVRFFKDRAVLQKVGLTAASNAVAFFQMVLSDYIASHCGNAGADVCTAMATVSDISIPMLPRIPNPRELVESHFDAGLMSAYKEFALKFPDIPSLSRDLRLDACRAAYNAALAKLQEPSRAQVLGATMVALAPPQNQAAVWQEVQQRLSTVKLASGAIGSYGQAAAAYIDGMAELMTRLARHSEGLPAIADEIGRRSAALKRAGEETEQAFRMLLPFVMPIPLGFYALSDLHSWAAVFTRYGESLGALSAELHGRADEYERMSATLDKELIRVSEEMNKYVP